jgi:hypothetical protein
MGIALKKRRNFTEADNGLTRSSTAPVVYARSARRSNRSFA